MSIIDFAQRLAELERQAARTEGKLDQLKNKIDNTKGPMDELVAQAERTGSAVGNVNGVMIEAVRMSGQAVPTLQGVAWKMYQIQKDMENAEGVSREILDRLALKMDSMIPQFDLWTKHVLQMAADGELNVDELMKKLEEMMSDPSTRQLNSLFNNDIDGFLLELRRMKEGIDDAAKTATEAAERVAESMTGGVSGGSSNTGGIGSSNGGSSSGGTMTGGSSVAGALVAEIRRIVR